MLEVVCAFARNYWQGRVQIVGGGSSILGMLAFHRCESLILIRLSLTQDEFAATYRIPVGTLLDWEQRRKMPDATARALSVRD